MQQGPANEAKQVTVMGSIRGIGDKTDGTVIDYIQFAEQSVGGYIINDIAKVKDRQDSTFYEGMFGSMSEGGFLRNPILDLILDWRC